MPSVEADQATLQTRRKQIKARMARNERWKASSKKLRKVAEYCAEAKASGRKVLIYSDYLSHCDAAAAALEAHGIECCELNRALTTTQQIALFHEDGGPTVMLLTSTGSAGIELTAASVVIILSPSWNPTRDEQLINRAHREDHNIDVNAYCLIAVDSVVRISRFCS